MQVQELIELLRRFDPEAEVQLSVSLPGRVVATHDNVWVADYGGGPQLIATLDFRHSPLYVGCGLEQLVTSVPRAVVDTKSPPGTEPFAEVDLGAYENDEIAARVRDFYNYHRRPDQPLGDPDFDYDAWIAPRTVTGEYNEHIAKILEEKLLKD
jgi:hypothetical protein